jgi:hypothetical protein
MYFQVKKIQQEIKENNNIKEIREEVICAREAGTSTHARMMYQVAAPNQHIAGFFFFFSF